MTNMDPTKPTTGEHRCSRMVDSETVKIHQDMLPKMTHNSTCYSYNQWSSVDEKQQSINQYFFNE